MDRVFFLLRLMAYVLVALVATETIQTFLLMLLSLLSIPIDVVCGREVYLDIINFVAGQWGYRIVYVALLVSLFLWWENVHISLPKLKKYFG